MKLVTMTRDMRPFQANHDALLPDDVADRLIAAGDARLPAGQTQAPVQPQKPVERRRGQNYLTK